MFAPRSSRPATVAIYPSKNGGLRRKKKGENITPAIELERILGLTTSKPTAISTAPTHDLVAYAAGSVVVLYNHKKNKQVGFLHASSAVSSAPPQPPPNRHTIVGDSISTNPLSSLGLLEPPGTNANGNSSKKPAVSNKAKPISCLAFSPDGNFLAVGEPITLNYLGTLPKPHPLGVDLTLQTGSTYNGAGDPNETYPDTTAIKFDAETGKLTCIYSDRSLFIWDIKDIKKIGKYRSFLYHCDTIWGVEMVPHDAADGTSMLPENTFVTYSADSTIRFWNFDGSVNSTASNGSSGGNNNNSSIKRNIYSKECLKIVYADPDGKYRSCALETKNEKSDSSDQLNATSVESGIRTLKISPDGKLMASGDQITYQEAHDAEILTIEFTDSRAPGEILHVFDVNNNFQLVQTLDDHSSSITAIKFTNDGGKLITTVFDMDIDISNRYIATVSGERRLNVYHIDTGKNVRSYKSDTPEEVNTADQGSLLRISLDPGGVHAVTGGSDKSIRLFDFTNGSILGKVLGHSELITGVKFTSDCERVISTSADGCIFVWKISDELVSKMRQKWLDRSGVSGSLEKTSPLMRDYLLPQSSTPPPTIPKSIMPAQKPQSLMVDLQQSSNDDGQESGFSVRRVTNGLKIKKSYSSLSAMELQNEENTKKFAAKRPASFANDSSSQQKSTQLTPRFSLDHSKLPMATSPPPSNQTGISTPPSNPTGISTPPNTPTNPSSARRESWKIGLPSWAKKAFKEKEEEKRPKDKTSNNNTNLVSNVLVSSPTQEINHQLNVEKKLPSIPKPLNRAKSQSKLRQDATKSLLNTESEKDELKPANNPASFNEKLSLPQSSILSTDAEVALWEVLKLWNLMVIDQKNVQKLEDFLHIEIQKTSADNSTLDSKAKKRQSLTMKFYTGSQRQSNDSSGRNSLIDALTKIIGKQDLAISEDEGGVSEALEALERKSLEIENHENHENESLVKEDSTTIGEDSTTIEQDSTTIGQDSYKKSPLPSMIYSTPSSPATSTKETVSDMNLKHDSDNGQYVNDNDLKVDDLGISISNGYQDNRNFNEPDANEEEQVNEECVMDDVVTMTVLLERTLLAYKKVSSPASKNESIAKLISDSLSGMMDDINKSLKESEEQTNDQVYESTKSQINVPEIIEPGHDTYHDEGDLEPMILYGTVSGDHEKKYSDLLVKMVEEKLDAKTKINVEESTSNTQSSINDNTSNIPAVNGKYTKPTKGGMIPVMRNKVRK
ncbi:7995_t:CDS:10 [Racocetra fulgida]|uniref:7995_t:CDS:1 n=2 Tax=Glomeromycetes TaxID=214506 RepID=A0A9N9EVQ3_9GLOM|nr:7995_t:CDS:10 [Racocetra fulgida]